MGTKAFIGFSNAQNIIGMTSDGFPNNLKVIGNQMFEALIEMDFFGKTLSQEDMVKVYNVAIKNDKNLFIDKYRNVQWISYYAIFSLMALKLSIFEEDGTLIQKVDFKSKLFSSQILE